jgi:hypothetical protein
MGKKAFIAAVLAVLLIVIFVFSIIAKIGFDSNVSPSTQPTEPPTPSPSPTPTSTPTPTTVQPSPSALPPTTPQPTPTPMQADAASMTYYEVSREEVGNDTRIKLSINATNNSASKVTIDYGSFYMNIITLKDIDHPDAAAKYYWKVTGEAVPLETGTISASESSPYVSFMLTFEFPTLQTFGEWASVVGTTADTEYPFSSYHLHYGNSSPIKPFSSSKEFSSLMDKLQSGKLELKNGNFSAPWPFKLIRVPLTIENINSGAAYTNQGKLYIYSSSIDIQELIYAWCILSNTDTVYYWLSDPSGSQFAFWVYISFGRNCQGSVYGNIFS